MTEDDAHPLPRAREDIERVRGMPDTPQTRSPTHRLAFADFDFLMREELRPVRLQLELLKAQMALDERGIRSTVVMFGGARIPSPADKASARTPMLAELSRYYDEARKFAFEMTKRSLAQGGQHWIVCTGGGPGVMEAGNRGAAEAGGQSIGLNIVLPHEQAPNRYVTPGLSFQFHYFALRKMHFLLRARAVCVFPGGFGTFDETFELLTLIQTGKIKPVPIVLFSKEFWTRVVNFDALVEEGVISGRDLSLFHFVETADEAWQIIQDFYAQVPVE